MYSGSGASRHDVLWTNVRTIVLGVMLIVLSVSQIFNITPDLHILEWVVLGVSGGVIIWSMISVIRNITKIRESGMYALPFTVAEGEMYQ